MPVAVDEIHRHVEHVVDIAFEAHAGLEGEGQHAGAVGIGIGPDMGAIALVAVGLALGEGRIGEERRGERLQRQADAELAHHVGLALEIEIYLHRAGAQHHVEAELAPAHHLIAHDDVAALGHPGHLRARRFGIEAHAQHADAELVADLLHLLQMGLHLIAGLVDRLDRGAGKLELSAGLQRDVAGPAGERDDIAVFFHRLPAEALQAAEQGADALRPLIGHAAKGLQIEAEFLMLGADAPLLGRLVSLLDIFHQLALAGDRFAARLGRSRHLWANLSDCGNRRKNHLAGGRSRPSPRSACQQARAAIAAVSARSTRGPRPTGVTNGSLRRWSSSLDAKPPSGPVMTA